MAGKNIQAGGPKNSLSLNKGYFKKHLYSLIIFSLSFGLYANTILNEYNLDDNLVTNNHKLTSLGIDGIPQIFSTPYYSDNMGYAYDYRPITLTTFAIENQFFGDNAAISHLVNVFLYAFLCVLILLVLKLLFPDAELLAFLVSLLFATHPIHTEVVCSIKNRDEILALGFSFLSLWVILITYQRKWVIGIPASALFFCLALLSKMTVIPMALVIPLTLISFTDINLKKAVALSFALFIPVFLLADIDILLYKALLLMAINACLIFIYLFKTSEFGRLKKLVLNRLSKLDQAIRHNRIKSVKQPIQSQAPIKELNSRSKKKFSLNLNFKLTNLLVPFISVFAFFISVYGLYFDDFVWTYCGFVLLIGGLYFYEAAAWKFNTILAFITALFLIEKYDCQFNFITDSLNILLITLIFWGKTKHKLLFVGLYALFLLHFLFTNLEGPLEIIFPLAFLYSVYNKRFIKLGYFICGIVLVTATITFFIYRTDPRITIFLLQFCSILFIVAIFFLQVKNKSVTPVNVLIVFFIPIVFIAEANLKVLAPYKNIDFNSVAISWKVYNWITPQQIRAEIQSVKNYFTKEKNQIQQKQISAIRKAEEVKRKITFEGTEKFNNARQNVSLKVNDLSQKIVAAQKTITNYQVRKISPIEEDRPLSFVENPVRVFDPLELKVASALDVLLRYFKLTFIPYPLSFYYGYKVIAPVSLDQPPIIASIILHSLLVFCALYFLWKRKYILFYGISLYLLMIVPFTNVWQSVPGMMAERYLFGASLGFCIISGYALFHVFTIGQRTGLTYLKSTTVIACSSLLLIYSISTFARCRNWRDDLTLMRHDIKSVEQSAQAHNLLAIHLMEHSDLAPQPTEKAQLINEALFHFNKATEIYPPFLNAVYYTGRVYEQIGAIDSAIAAYKRALLIDSTFTDLHLKLGDLLQNNGRYDEALPYYGLVLKDRPLEYTGYDKLSYTYYLLHQYTYSINVNQQAIMHLPGVIDPYINIGRTYIALHEPDSARLYFNRALTIDSNNTIVKTLLTQVNTFK